MIILRMYLGENIVNGIVDVVKGRIVRSTEKEYNKSLRSSLYDVMRIGDLLFKLNINTLEKDLSEFIYEGSEIEKITKIDFGGKEYLKFNLNLPYTKVVLIPCEAFDSTGLSVADYCDRKIGLIMRSLQMFYGCTSFDFFKSEKTGAIQRKDVIILKKYGRESFYRFNEELPLTGYLQNMFPGENVKYVDEWQVKIGRKYYLLKYTVPTGDFDIITELPSDFKFKRVEDNDNIYYQSARNYIYDYTNDVKYNISEGWDFVMMREFDGERYFLFEGSYTNSMDGKINGKKYCLRNSKHKLYNFNGSPDFKPEMKFSEFNPKTEQSRKLGIIFSHNTSRSINFDYGHCVIDLVTGKVETGKKCYNNAENLHKNFEDSLVGLKNVKRN